MLDDNSVLLQGTGSAENPDCDLSTQWVGNSTALKQLQQRLGKYAGVDFPVMIKGGKGTGKLLAALTIHRLSSRAEYAFVECDCYSVTKESCTKKIGQDYNKACDGTLFLRNLNALPSQALHELNHYWEREYMGQRVATRIVCSLSPDYPEQAISASAAPWLPLTLPTLAERKSDIGALVLMLLRKYATIKPVTLSEQCISVFCAFPWQDNVKGLERAVALVSVMADQPRIELTQLLQILPELDQRAKATTSFGKEVPVDTLKPTGILSNDASSCENCIEFGFCENHLVEAILDKSCDQLPLGHGALTKSLVRISESYKRKITLEAVAKSAFVSAPHLSYLYRKHLGLSFKQLLLKVRIEQSKRLLLQNNDMQVTEISYEVGFHDLSHFEKVFRKLVGTKPLQFRNSNMH